MAYVYKADLWCDDCAEEIKKRLKAEGEAPEDEEDESSFDSDNYPKGPSPDDDPADTPFHCPSEGACPNAVELDDGSKVGAIISGLTEEGILYVREALEESDTPLLRAWAKHYGTHYDLEPFTVYLDNLDDREGQVRATVRGPGALRWAKHDRTIAGNSWEGIDKGDDIAIAFIHDYPGLVSALEEEGYTLNLDEYSPPEKEEA